MCLCRSNGTGVVVRRRVAADARLPVAILLPVASPLSPSPPPTVTTFVLFAVLFFSSVNCSATFVTDSVDGTESTGSDDTINLVPETSGTTSGNRLTSTDLMDVVASSYELKSQMTTENFDQSTPADTDSDSNSRSPQMSVSANTRSPRETANNRHFRSSTAPEVALDNIYVSTWLRLGDQEKAVSPTSSFYSSTSNRDSELTVTSESSLNDIRQSSTENTFTDDKMLDVSLKTTSTEALTTTVPVSPAFDEKTDVSETIEVTSNVEVSPAGAARSSPELRPAVESKSDTVGVDRLDAEYFSDSASTESNTRRDERLTPPPTTGRSAANRTIRTRCLQMRTGGGDTPAAIDCHQDRIVDDHDDNDGPSGTTNRRRRRRLKFCDAYSAYVGDLDCAPSSSCLDFLCPEVVRLDRLAESMNDQFIDRILNYDCEHRYSRVWNCSACKVTAAQLPSRPIYKNKCKILSITRLTRKPSCR